MAEAMIAEKYFTADAALRYKYEQREKSLRDQRSRENHARKEGREEGREEEKDRGIVKMISSLREFDIPEAAILQKIMEKYDLGLSVAEKYMAMSAYDGSK